VQRDQERMSQASTHHNSGRSLSLASTTRTTLRLFFFLSVIATSSSYAYAPLLSNHPISNPNMISASRTIYQRRFRTLARSFPSQTFLSCSRNDHNHENDNAKAKAKATTIDTTSNEYMAQARNAVEAAKRQSRKAALDNDKERNLRLKRLLHTDANTDTETSENGHVIPKMYQLRVSVDRELREELRMNGREKRGRVFIETASEGCQTVKGLKFEMHAFFRALKKSTYLLSANLPQVLEDGSIFSPGDEKVRVEGEDPYSDFWSIECDEDVVKTFEKAQEFFTSYNNGLSEEARNQLTRPSILVHVRKDPNAAPPPPPPAYLEGMENPEETETMTMLSFYSFPPGGVKDPEEFALSLRKGWKPFGALGRVYIAGEGINAQMSIPTNV